MVEWNAVLRGEWLEVGVIGDDDGDFDGQLVGGLAEEEVVEAVSDFRDHDQDARLLGDRVHGEVAFAPVQFGAQGGEVGCQFLGAEVRFLALDVAEVDAHEELGGIGVAVLLGVQDVEVAFCEKSSHGVHDTRSVRT